MAKRPPARWLPPCATPMLQLKISLYESDPLIWRRLLIFEGQNLYELHYVCQILMGWRDCHLHDFVAPATKQSYGNPQLLEQEGVLDEEQTELREVFQKVGDLLLYRYDFGDSWYCDIALEAKLPIPDNDLRPKVLAGELAAPPEDCGGLPGFYALLAVLKDPQHPEYRDLRRWVGPKYDPQVCHPPSLTRKLRRA